jgi:hypothetical protein
VLVLSGETTDEVAAAAAKQPHLTVANIGELGEMLENSKFKIQNSKFSNNP